MGAEMLGWKSGAVLASLGIVATVLVVFSFSDIEDVIREDLLFVSKNKDDAEQFVGHALSGKDQQFESAAIEEVLAEANAITQQKKLAKYKRRPVGPQIAPTAPKEARLMELQASEKAEATATAKASRIIAHYKKIEKQLKAFATVDAETVRANNNAKASHKQPPEALLATVKGMHSNKLDKKLLANKNEKEHKLRSLILAVEDKYHGTAEESTRTEKLLKKGAHDHSIELQHQAKKKATAVIRKARKGLQKVLKTVSATLTNSVDQRQRARAKLVTLRSKHADDVQTAQAALELAKVNHATHLTNLQSRQEAREAKARATRSINFARTILASRLNAIQTTERLTLDKAELHSHEVMTVAKEALSRTTQSVLMALDDDDANTNLEEIVGEDGTESQNKEQVSQESLSENAQLEMETDDTHGNSELDEENLIDSHAAELTGAAADQIFTTKMHKCKFPFVYNGQKFYHCKHSVQGSWCATDLDESNAVKKWDYCVLNKRAVALAKQAAMAAAKLEIKRVLAATGADLTPGALRESLQAAAAVQVQTPEAKHTSKVVKAAKPEEEDLESHTPVMGRVQAESQVDSLINEASSHLKK